MRRFSRLDIVVAIGAILMAMWQLLLIEPSFFGFVVIWMLPPFLAVAINAFGGRSNLLTRWASVYLATMAVVQSIASTPALLPQFTALDPTATDFAMTWNQLDVVSRRVISANMALTGVFGFAFLGYVFGWRPLFRSGEPLPLSWPICILSLVTLWVLPGLGLLGLIVAAFAGR